MNSWEDKEPPPPLNIETIIACGSTLLTLMGVLWNALI